jgi:hypothetical protein
VVNIGQYGKYTVFMAQRYATSLKTKWHFCICFYCDILTWCWCWLAVTHAVAIPAVSVCDAANQTGNVLINIKHNLFLCALLYVCSII